MEGNVEELDQLADELAGDTMADMVEWLAGVKITDGQKMASPQREKEQLKVEDIVQIIQRTDRPARVVVMAGAGVSTSAGIPDFRTPGTGLYDNLAKYNLPYKTAIFDLSYFRQRPEPFYLLAREMFPGKWCPTPTHYFVKLLQEKGLLHKHFTQNIDTLERVAGIAPELLVEAHGAFGEAACIECNAEFPIAEVEQNIMATPLVIPHCKQCQGLVKPRITFFGESLPARFFTESQKLVEADVLIVMGTSLQVHPFASLVDLVPRAVPRLLLNREPVGPFEAPSKRDVLLLGDCDSGVEQLVKLLGWEKDFAEVVSKGKEAFERSKM